MANVKSLESCPAYFLAAERYSILRYHFDDSIGYFFSLVDYSIEALCVCVCMYIYIYIYMREREREKVFRMKFNRMRKKKTILNIKLTCFTKDLPSSEYKLIYHKIWIYMIVERSVIIYVDYMNS